MSWIDDKVETKDVSDSGQTQRIEERVPCDPAVYFAHDVAAQGGEFLDFPGEGARRYLTRAPDEESRLGCCLMLSASHDIRISRACDTDEDATHADKSGIRNRPPPIGPRESVPANRLSELQPRHQEPPAP